MFDNLRNNIDFFIRNKTKFSRKNFVEHSLELLQRNEAENHYTKDVLEQCFTKENLKQVRCLDIGCKNWFYARGEYSFFADFCDDVYLDGVEIDAYRLYSNFYSRLEVAKFYIKDLRNTNYIAANVLDLNSKYDYIVWFLPFVFEEPLMYWGLPLRYFCPKKLLAHAYSLLNDNGQMLIVNQGEDEMEEQKKMLDELDIPFVYKGEIHSDYFQYKNKRYAFVVRKSYK